MSHTTVVYGLALHTYLQFHIASSALHRPWFPFHQLQKQISLVVCSEYTTVPQLKHLERSAANIIWQLQQM